MIDRMQTEMTGRVRSVTSTATETATTIFLLGTRFSSLLAQETPSGDRVYFVAQRFYFFANACGLTLTLKTTISISTSMMC
jgi:hypothetical protein